MPNPCKANSAALATRAMQPAHLPAVAAIEARVQPFPWRQQQFADSLAAGHQGWVLQSAAAAAGSAVAPPAAHEVLGYAVLMPVLDEIELLRIAIAGQQQGQGLGRWLLAWLMRQAGSEGKRSMLLEVAAANQPARRLYASMGFTIIGERRAYYRDAAGRCDDALVMCCPLGNPAVLDGAGCHDRD